MEELAEGFLRTIFGVIRWILWEVAFNSVLFNIGRLSLLLITGGKYPSHDVLESDINKISMTGVAVIVVVLLGIALYNNYGRIA